MMLVYMCCMCCWWRGKSKRDDVCTHIVLHTHTGPLSVPSGRCVIKEIRFSMREMMGSCCLVKNVPLLVRTSESNHPPVSLSTTADLLSPGAAKLTRWSHSSALRSCLRKKMRGFHEICTIWPFQCSWGDVGSIYSARCHVGVCVKALDPPSTQTLRPITFDAPAGSQQPTWRL